MVVREIRDVVPGSMLLVAPHHDDVALSCGGVAAVLAQTGAAPAIITVFASELLDGMVGSFAEWKHSRWGISDLHEVQDIRRAEDLAAAIALGCRLRWLGLPDAIYRGDRYGADEALYGRIHPEEAGLADHLATELMHLPEWQPDIAVAVPLGVGSHVDHQICFEAGRVLAARGANVFAYEDLPYGIHTPAAVQARLGQLQGVVDAPLLFNIESGLHRKIAAISRFGTQLPVIFRFTSSWRDAIAGHARELGAGTAVERLWALQG